MENVSAVLGTSEALIVLHKSTDVVVWCILIFGQILCLLEIVTFPCKSSEIIFE